MAEVAQDLHTEATSGNPEPGRLRQFATQLKDKLLEGTTSRRQHRASRWPSRRLPR
ncbi:hypothetical protein OG215_40370 (plasmid) [Streptomyces globisporus]|uniref:hypothetical protein n=1 Tax=Streptomyces globisporus TaxID=1908 RepID=UPI002F911BB7|nr:hypothetical protein OG215_40370 [Streptomyces globisporus]